YTGLSLDEINDRSKLAQVIHPEDRLAVFEHYDQALQKGSIYQQEFRLKRAADGEYRWFLARSVPLRDERERIVRWFGTCTNNDEQKRAEETLQEADRRKDKFIAMLSHELRNPLAPIRNALHLLHLNPTDHTTWKEARDVIGRQLQQLSRIVDDLLDVFRITNHKITLHRETLDLAQLTGLI